MKIFKLEEYLTRYEFTCPFLLSSSDAQSWQLQDIVDLSTPKSKKLWDSLSLGYTEPFGYPALREEIASSFYPGLKAENVLCFSGAEEGIFATLTTLCGPKDHAIVISPCYQSLLEVPRSRGTEISQILLKEEKDWQLDIEEITQALQPNTKVIVINFPHNPTGQMIAPQTLMDLRKLCERHNIWLFSDEVYRLLGSPEAGWTAPAACLYNKGISLGVMSKAFGMAGLRIGWIACQDEDLLQDIKRFKDYLSICNSAPSEILSLIAVQNKDTILARNNNHRSSRL